MMLATPAPFVSALIDAVDDAIRQANPGSGRSAMQRTWLAFCLSATLVTPSICWARFERASLGTYAMATLSWMFRHRKLPGEQRLVASVRVMLRDHGITSGRLVIDDTDTSRSTSASKLAYLQKLHDQESGGYVWGQSVLFLLWVTPKISIPVGLVFSPPTPQLRAWQRQEKVRKQRTGCKVQRQPKAAPHPNDPTQPQLAWRLLEDFKANHPDLRVHLMTAEALYGTGPFVDAASALFGGVQVISQLRSHQHLRSGKREPHVADYFATHAGTPQRLCMRGGEDIVAMVSSARW